MLVNDERFMARALSLARRGFGRVSPNPLVGAVVVRNGIIAGEGAHLELGGAHAERHALDHAGDRSRNATVFVNLEPCCHTGRTAPCTSALAEAGVARVVCAMEDPDPRVSGNGVRALRQAGIDVEVGLLRERAEELNRAYLTHRREERPFVILKLAQSLDGRIATATGSSRWITGDAARRHVHEWRSRVDALAVGASTVATDDPSLDARLRRGRQRRDPRPIVIDGRLRVSPEARVFARDGAILATLDSTPSVRHQQFRECGVEVWTFSERGGRIDLRDLARKAARNDVASLIVEGGGVLAATALADGIVDRLMVYVAPIVIGEGIAAIGQLGVNELAQAVSLDRVLTRRIGEDLLYTADVR